MNPAMQILSSRTVDQLKDDYREAKRRERTDPDANEARRLITVAPIRKLGRSQTALFERTEIW